MSSCISWTLHVQWKMFKKCCWYNFDANLTVPRLSSIFNIDYRLAGYLHNSEHQEQAACLENKTSFSLFSTWLWKGATFLSLFNRCFSSASMRKPNVKSGDSWNIVQPRVSGVNNCGIEYPLIVQRKTSSMPPVTSIGRTNSYSFLYAPISFFSRKWKCSA